METSLHRQLKELYAATDAEQEVKLGSFRIDVVNTDALIEIQHGSLAAIRDKIACLVKTHQVAVVKPIVARKRIVRLGRRGGAVVARRWSPKRGTVLSLFDELVYFTRVFPHENLTLEVPLVQVEERRFPGHGRRRWRRDNDFQVDDLRLLQVDQTHQFRTAADLQQLLPQRLPSPFHTGHLAQQLGVQSWVAQRIAYCLRETGSTIQVGKQGNAKLYQRAPVAA
jgi:hypothetical protein